MAKNDDGLGVQKQINDLLDKRLRTQIDIGNVVASELRLTAQLQKLLGNISQKEYLSELGDVNDTIEVCNEALIKNKELSGEAFEEMRNGAKTSTKQVGILNTMFHGMGSTMKTLITTGTGLAKNIFQIGKALLSIPLGIFKGLMADAAAASGDTSFLEALENIRKEFGSFKEGTSKDILNSYTSLNSQFKQVSGLSVWQVFKTPAEQLQYLQEMASKAGSQILQFGGEISKSAGVIATFDKGMGIGAENMKSMMARATVFGTTLTTQLGEVANYALQLGKDFGISSKIISREVSTMVKDVRNFGSLTQKEMTVAAVYTKKLGLEMKDLTALVDKFDNFDKAAESAAQLSQAFGATVDAFKMMNEQDPAKRLDELRKSMAATGKSTENMTRQELHLLAQTSGLSDEAAKLAFSTKNQGLSYDQVQKQANKAELAQIKQADALAKLADNIERVVRSGGQMHSSFFKMFMAGMEQGVKWSNSYRTAMMNVRTALMQTFQAGRQVGKELGDNDAFGFARFMKGFGTTFGPGNVNKILHGFTKEIDENGVKVKKSFGGVVGELNAAITGKQGFGDAIAHIRSTFHAAVGPETFKMMIDGGKDMIRSLAKGIGSSGSFVVKEMTKVLEDITDFISNPKAYLDKAKAGAGGAKGFGAEIISSIIKTFDDPNGEKLKAFGSAFVGFLVGIGKMLKKTVENPRVQKAVLEVAGPFLMAMVGKNMLGLVPGILSKFGPSLARLLTTGIGGSLAAAGGVALAGAALVNVNKKMDKFEADIDKRRDPASKKMGAFGASLLQGLLFGLIPDSIAGMLANKIAELADGLFDAIKEKMGSSFTGKLKTYFGSLINFFSSVGGLIGAIFSGDSGAISAAAEKVGDNLVKVISSGFDFLVTEFPKLLVKLISVIDTVVGSIFEGIGNSLIKLGDKFGIMGSGIKFVGILFVDAGKMLKEFGRQAEWMFNKVKDFDLSKSIAEQVYGLKQSFMTFQSWMLDSLPGPVLTMMGLNEKGRAQMRDTLNKNAAELRKNFLEVNKIATEAQKAEEDRKNGVAAAATQQPTAVNSPAKNAVGPSPVAQQTQIDVESLMSQKKTLEENLKSLTEFASGGVIKSISESIPKASTAITDFNDKLSKSSIENTISVTQGVVKSINDLNMILGDGNAGSIKVGEKLQRFANNSGLGKNGTYEIKNKGIQLKLDLKITMDAGEVEQAILMRKDSIIFDILDNNALTPQNEQKVKEMAARKGGA